MCEDCTVDVPTLAVYLTQVTIDQQWEYMDFPNRPLKKNVKPSTLAAFETSKQERQNEAPAVFVLDTVYHVLLFFDSRNAFRVTVRKT